jgi:hypothetical protein
VTMMIRCSGVMNLPSVLVKSNACGLEPRWFARLNEEVSLPAGRDARARSA